MIIVPRCYPQKNYPQTKYPQTKYPTDKIFKRQNNQKTQHIRQTKTTVTKNKRKISADKIYFN